MKRQKIAVVSYQNTIPFLYGLNHSDFSSELELIITPPFQCANNLSTGVVDIALIPAVKLLDIENIHIFSDYSISASDNVYTVALFSNKPIEELETIHLDSHSRTSVELLKILMREYWKQSPNYTTIDEIGEVASDEGYLLIGDKVFENEHKFKYKYDLAHHWLNHTGKPFVFAVWVAKDGTPSEVEELVNSSLAMGVSSIDKAIQKYGALIPNDKLYSYLTKNIEFDLSQDKRDALKLFLNKVKDPSPAI